MFAEQALQCAADQGHVVQQVAVAGTRAIFSSRGYSAISDCGLPVCPCDGDHPTQPQSTRERVKPLFFSDLSPTRTVRTISVMYN